jgi:SAM-dependent methyltransferase
MDPAAERARRTYDAAADHYDSLGFWARAGARTIERLELAPGARVLDAPCGSGASALPAARRGASVIAVDVSESQIALARTKTPPNVEFRVADMRSLEYPDGHFDAVVSVFGIFFVPDMAALARGLWRMVAPGGVLAVTTWGDGVFEPGATALWDAVGRVRPDLVRGFEPWTALGTPAKLLAILDFPGATAELEDGWDEVDWWDMVLGTGYRATVDALSHSQRIEVEREVRERLASAPLMHGPVIYGSARKPG